MEENLFVNLEYSPVSMQLDGFLPETVSQKKPTKKPKNKKRVTP